MRQIQVKITLVIFRIYDEALCVYLTDKHLPSETISQTESLEEQVEKIFTKHIDSPFTNNYVEQLYTISQDNNEITIVYYILLANTKKQLANTQNWIKISGKKFFEKQIITYALQRLRWKMEYTNVVYSLLPKTFTLSDLQKTYEIILGKKLDKRNFRKKILSLHFLKPTGEKRIDNARPAQMYSFIQKTPQIVKVFS